MSKVFANTPSRHSQCALRESSLTASSVNFDGYAVNTVVIKGESKPAMANTTFVHTDSEKNHAEVLGNATSNLKPDDMNSWTLPQLRDRLESIITVKQAASVQQKADLETEKLALFKRFTIAARAEKRRRRAERSGKIPLLETLLD